MRHRKHMNNSMDTDITWNKYTWPVQTTARDFYN